MRNKLLLAVTAAVFLFPLGVQKAHAFNPQPPWCLYNCVVPTAEIYANPATVSAPANGTGNTQIIWKWNESEASPVMPYACVYVVVNNANTASSVDCEHPDNYYYVNIPWIAPGNQYRFIVSYSVGNSVLTRALKPLAPMTGASYDVYVQGVVSGGGGGGGGGSGGGSQIGDN
jgi:hypothetical protein